MDLDQYLTGVLIDLFQPHVIVPAQHFNPPKKLAPEHRLMMAVLDDAVRCVEKYRCPTDARARRRDARDAGRVFGAGRSAHCELTCAVPRIGCGSVLSGALNDNRRSGSHRIGTAAGVVVKSCNRTSQNPECTKKDGGPPVG
jgi:hypothetical protein